jgi:hypothetical protein
MRKDSPKPITVAEFHKEVEGIAQQLNRTARPYTPKLLALKDKLTTEKGCVRSGYFGVAFVIVICTFLSYNPDHSTLVDIACIAACLLGFMPLVLNLMFHLDTLTNKPSLWFNRPLNPQEEKEFVFFMKRQHILHFEFVQQALVRWMGQKETVGYREEWWVKQAYGDLKKLCYDLMANPDISSIDKQAALDHYSTQEHWSDGRAEILQQWQTLKIKAQANNQRHVLNSTTPQAGEAKAGRRL